MREGAGSKRPNQRPSWWSSHEQRLIPYIFLTPNLLVFTIFMFFPLLFAIFVSFHEWNIIGTAQFNGLKNYVRMASDPQFWQSLRNTVVYTVGTVPTSMALGLFVAILLNRRLPGRAFLRSIYFMPVVISGVVVALVGTWIFNEDYGIVNEVLGWFGVSGVHWLSSPTWAMPSLIVVTLWIRLGFCMVIYLAGLQSIPEMYYDAARVDGASPWRRFRHITWPLLGPTTFLILILNVIFSFQVFDIIYVMTGGGPGFSTTVLVQYIYQQAFQNSQFGYASAMGIVLYLMILIFTVVQWRISRQDESVY
jgi:multiple sugar transport system permease protein